MKMIIALNQEYIIQTKEIQIQVGGTGVVSVQVSQDKLPYATIKSITAGDAPEIFNLKHCNIKFLSSDNVLVSVKPDQFVLSEVD
jgi:hypothetical protein